MMINDVSGRNWYWLILPFIILLGCQNQEAEMPIASTEIEPDTILPPIPDTTTTETEREFPRLSSKIAPEFLLSYFNDNPERKIKMTTRLGVVKFRLFDDTPIHTANFLMLVKRNYFNNTEFTRIVKNFVVQGGNNEKEQEEIKRLIIGAYELPPEIKPEHLHKRGALAMARRYEDNPDKRSSAYNFYFVQGQVLTEPQLLATEREHDIEIPEWKRKIYRTIGGSPHLDGEHTVFGEIYEGLDVLEKMSLVNTDTSDWPKEPLIMKMEVIDE